MPQRVNVKIADHEFGFDAPNAESEELIRLAASIINKKMAEYFSKFPGKSENDVLSMLALNECIRRLSLGRKLENIQNDVEGLVDQTNKYLESLNK